jgi:hypothetical protein
MESTITADTSNGATIVQAKYIVIAALALAAGVSALILVNRPSSSGSHGGEAAHEASSADRDSSLTSSNAAVPKPASLAKGSQAASDKPAAAQLNLRENDLLVDGNSLDTSTVLNLAQSEQGYNQLLRALAADSTVEAAEKTQKFQNLFLTRPMYLSGVVQVAELECGLKLGAAIVTSQDRGKISEFVDSMSAAKEPAMYVSMKIDSQTPSGTPSARWVFSGERDVDSAGS